MHVAPIVQCLQRVEDRSGVTVVSYHVCAGNGIQVLCKSERSYK